MRPSTAWPPKAGSQTVANCASCHGVHNILPSSDPKSTINAKNLPTTCGKCHPGAGQRFAISRCTWSKAAPSRLPLRWVREFYLLVIPVTIGLMLLHNGGDWVRKLIRLRFRARTPAGRRLGDARHAEVRMLPFERVQHAVLVISFLVLVWTGFALKYPDQWWARPLLLWEAPAPAQPDPSHRGGQSFMVVSVTHLVSLIVSRKLREHWKEMLPKAADAREGAVRTLPTISDWATRRRAARRTATSKRPNTGPWSGAQSSWSPAASCSGPIT